MLGFLMRGKVSLVVWFIFTFVTNILWRLVIFFMGLQRIRCFCSEITCATFVSAVFTMNEKVSLETFLIFCIVTANFACEFSHVFILYVSLHCCAVFWFVGAMITLDGFFFVDSGYMFLQVSWICCHIFAQMAIQRWIHCMYCTGDTSIKSGWITRTSVQCCTWV